jgi:hypothetical protein
MQQITSCEVRLSKHPPERCSKRPSNCIRLQSRSEEASTEWHPERRSHETHPRAHSRTIHAHPETQRWRPHVHPMRRKKAVSAEFVSPSRTILRYSLITHAQVASRRKGNTLACLCSCLFRLFLLGFLLSRLDLFVAWGICVSIEINR